MRPVEGPRLTDRPREYPLEPPEAVRGRSPPGATLSDGSFPAALCIHQHLVGRAQSSYRVAKQLQFRNAMVNELGDPMHDPLVFPPEGAPRAPSRPLADSPRLRATCSRRLPSASAYSGINPVRTLGTRH